MKKRRDQNKCNNPKQQRGEISRKKTRQYGRFKEAQVKEYPPLLFPLSAQQKQFLQKPDTIYNDEMHPDIAYRICKETGATIKQLANIFGVVISTISVWMQTHPKFYGAVIEGREHHDVHRVEKTLLQRALGYEIPIIKENTSIREQLNRKGKPIELITTNRVTETLHISPDVAAIRYYLANRNPERWSLIGNVKHEHRHKVDGKVNVNLNLKKLSTNDLKRLHQLAKKIDPEEDRKKQKDKRDLIDNKQRYVIDMKEIDGKFIDSNENTSIEESVKNECTV